MEKLTMYIDEKVFYSQNGNPILPVEMLDTPLVREVLKKLSEYEDIGTIEEFKTLKEMDKEADYNCVCNMKYCIYNDGWQKCVFKGDLPKDNNGNCMQRKFI